MGYDCYVRNPAVPMPADPADWSAPGAWEEYSALRQEWKTETHSYFRRSLSGGSRLAAALLDVGMGFDAEQWVPCPEFPHQDDYGITDWDDDGGPVGGRAEEYQAAVTVVLDWHGPEIPGIPVHKVCGSNDGWHVTREECRAALVLYEKALGEGRSHPEAFMDDFIPFLRAAARADGFEVH